MDGIINIFKEKGYTSQDVASIVKRLSGEKTGHAGTLDPEAEGVLVILVGKGTKLSDYLMAGEKEYRATVKLGVSTDTYDHTGNVLETHSVNISEAKLKEAVESFVGEQLQMPPMFSAIKKDGRKLYDLARKGITVELSPRKIYVQDIFLERFDGIDQANIYVKCGKGTYIRSICHDLGQKLGCGAHMTALVRTKSGAFSDETGVTIGTLRRAYESGGKEALQHYIISIDDALSSFSKLIISERAGSILYNGGKISQRFVSEGKIESLNLLYDESNNLIGIYEALKNENGETSLRPKTMLYRGV